jgi:predicted O-linked N-acetylglucosamine transferase (SPINDLY family)
MVGQANPVQKLIALHAKGRFAEMESVARSLLKRGAPPVVSELLGMALCGQRRFAEALSPLQDAAQLGKTDAQFWENLALCQRELGQFAEAEQSLRMSLSIRPFSPEALNSLGSVLRSLLRHGEAEAALRSALAIAPRHASACFNLGNVLSDVGRFAEAEACLRQAIATEPGNPRPYTNLAVLLWDLARNGEAEAAAREALARIPRIGVAATDDANLMADVAAGVLSRLGRVREAIRIYRDTGGYRRSPACLMDAFSAVRRACDWDFATEIEAEAQRKDMSFWTREPAAAHPMLLMPSATAAVQLAVGRTQALQYAAVPALPRSIAKSSSSNGRIRIGYLSGDFREHAVGAVMVGVFEAHDREQFEIVGYDYSPPAASALRSRIERGFERFVVIRDLSFGDAARRIAEDDCDIVVDLAGWTTGTRSAILAARPAPTQVQWLGFAGTMGAPWIDYILADRVLVAEGEEEGFSEKIIRLPRTYSPTDDRVTVGTPPPRAELGLPEDAFVFCSFNQPRKITSEVFDCWMSLLSEVAGSVLWLQDLNPDATNALRAHAARHAIGPDRLIFAPWAADRAAHLARLSQADLALDCYPYGSHTTGSDILWAGVPLVGLAGKTFVSRVSASIMSAAGMADFVTTSLQDYRDLALRLARDSAVLADAKRRAVASRRMPLFDTVGFTRNLEAAFRAIVERQRAGLPSDHVTIAEVASVARAAEEPGLG